ncbi:MAG TPA: CRTAC1 family protein, partial [Planctomycetota bacterium]|nr:CRTAC1 family protein [Planctomycetota bacterium]
TYIELELDPRRRRGVPDCTYKGVPIFCGPGGLEPAADSLFLSRGGGRFEDASETWGIRKARASYGLGTIIIDLDQSGFPDIVVANDTLANFAFLNQNGTSLIDAALFLGLAYNDYGVAQAGMGLAAGDLRGTGREDIFVTNFEDDTNTLYRAGEKGTFVEDTWPAGLGSASYRYLGWGTFFFDVEGDGDLDLFIANGHIAPQVDQVRASAGYRQPNQLFVNDGKGKFEEDAAFRAAEEARKASSRGAAFGDLDGDGDPDVVVSNIDGPPTILENRSRRSSSGAAARWVRVKLEGRRSNRAAIGARVTLESGGTKQLRVVRSGESYASQCELDPIFALDPATQEARITIEWPAGGRQSIELGASERVLRVREE